MSLPHVIFLNYVGMLHVQGMHLCLFFRKKNQPFVFDNNVKWPVQRLLQKGVPGYIETKKDTYKLKIKYTYMLSDLVLQIWYTTYNN